jgi:hypothetical protein
VTTPPATGPHPVAEPVVQAVLDAWSEAGRCSHVPITGASMWPLLLPGDTALIEHGHQDWWIGDVLAYRPGNQLVIHRLLRQLETGTLLLGGDNQPQPDPPVPREAVLGRVVAVEAQGRQFRLDGRLLRIMGLLWAGCSWARKQHGGSPLLSRFSHLLVRAVRR